MTNGNGEEGPGAGGDSGTGDGTTGGEAGLGGGASLKKTSGPARIRCPFLYRSQAPPRANASKERVTAVRAQGFRRDPVGGGASGVDVLRGLAGGFATGISNEVGVGSAALDSVRGLTEGEPPRGRGAVEMASAAAATAVATGGDWRGTGVGIVDAMTEGVGVTDPATAGVGCGLCSRVAGGGEGTEATCRGIAAASFASGVGGGR